MTKPGRIPCVVPFCRRTTAGKAGAEWICGNHWPMVPKARRRVWGRLRKRWRRYGPEAGEHFPARWWRVWAALKREAIERATGIS